MISRSESLLERYAGLNWFDENYSDFEERLEKGTIPIPGIKPWFLIRTYCTDCDEPCVAIRYHGRRIALVEGDGFWIPHQCPYEIGPEEGRDEPTPEEEIDWSERQDIEQELLTQTHPDDPNVRDGDGEIRGQDWSDPGTEPRSFADPAYSFDYPDVPYVPPGEYK